MNAEPEQAAAEQAEPEQAAAEQTKADCYSDGERDWMVRSQQLRAVLFAPLLRTLALLRISPDHLTFLSLVSGLAFCPLWFVSAPWALVALVLHVLLDGIDGPLARHLGVASSRGSFTDTLSDQAVVTASTITLMYAGLVHAVPGAIYIYVYAVVVAFAMVRNALDVPYSWLFRPRFVVYVWIPIELYWWPGTLNVLLALCSVLLGAKMLSGFLRIRKHI